MKKLFATLAFLAMLSFPYAQAQQLIDNSDRLSRVAGVRVVAAYNTWSAQVATAPAATGSGTITLKKGYVTLADGTPIQPFATNAPITVGAGANAETVTPSAVSGCAIHADTIVCSVTATFSNLHAPSDPVVSGTAGFMEAANDTTVSGGILMVDDQFKGSTSTITSNACFANVGVEDERGGVEDFYNCNGTAYVKIFSQGPQLLQGSCTGVGTASSTLGLYGLGQFAALTCTSTVVNLGVIQNRAGTLATLAATATAAGTNASSGVVTVLKNGSATTLTCTIGTGTSCTDTTHTATFVAGDVISIQFTTQGADTLAGVKGSVLTK